MSLNIPLRVPLIGERVKLVAHYHTYVVQCQFEARTVSVIIGDGLGTVCQQCGTQPAAQLIDPKVQLGFARPQESVLQ